MNHEMHQQLRKAVQHEMLEFYEKRVQFQCVDDSLKIQNLGCLGKRILRFCNSLMFTNITIVSSSQSHVFWQKQREISQIVCTIQPDLSPTERKLLTGFMFTWRSSIHDILLNWMGVLIKSRWECGTIMRVHSRSMKNNGMLVHVFNIDGNCCTILCVASNINETRCTVVHFGLKSMIMDVPSPIFLETNGSR